jgi:hypothetical protein
MRQGINRGMFQARQNIANGFSFTTEPSRLYDLGTEDQGDRDVGD